VKPAIVFDLGKVLVDFDYSIGARKIVARSLHPPENLHKFLGDSPILARFESGLLTRQQFFAEMKNIVGFLGDESEFVADFADIFIPIPPMIELHAKLRREFPTYIFSNTNDIAVEHIGREFPFFNKFDGYIFSYQIGAMKPQPKIYEALEEMSGKRGADLLYIDDRAENIAAGAARGWRTVLHESPEKTRIALQRFLCNG
jgi:FMN phosphatase YigB (HAD superfamily)